MKEWSQRNETGIRAVAITAVLLAMIGIWSAFVTWRADRTPVPVPVNGFVPGNGTTEAGETGGIELSRRIIVYQSVTDEGEGDTAEG